ncbi:hypothetical protein [Bacteroides reticulotermitis]|uniref:hypothetical protein n=1 Tax=Bacteroides reticulotermitis TaxID=1133319 RepID=UPI003A8B9237
MDAIDITESLVEFREHIDLNNRAILSAKFGDGKTYFLDKFKKKYKDEFYFITIYPVNYSVAENSDIFEYIKRDIIVQLANDHMLSDIDFTSIVDTLFSWENTREVISYLLAFVPAGDFYDKLLNKGKKFYDKYEEKKKTCGKYVKYFETQKGGLYEHDAYTKLIENAIEYIQNNKKQKVALVFEDLDRIDPAHLFRILNVLGANIDCQFNNRDSCKPNKFGADNIITVFDYEVTAHLFHHFYGKEANYSGYINKFMAHYPFYYSIKQIAIDFLYNYIETECYISRNTISRLAPNNSGDTIGKAIDKLSVRDIKQILDNIEDQVINDIIVFQNNNVKFHALNSATIFFAIFKRMNIDGYYNIPNALFAEPMNYLEILNLASSFSLHNSIIEKYNSISIDRSNSFLIKKYEDANAIIRLQFISNNGGKPLGKKEIDQDILDGLRESLQYVKC